MLSDYDIVRKEDIDASLIRVKLVTSRSNARCVQVVLTRSLLHAIKFFSSKGASRHGWAQLKAATSRALAAVNASEDLCSAVNDYITACEAAFVMRVPRNNGMRKDTNREETVHHLTAH